MGDSIADVYAPLWASTTRLRLKEWSPLEVHDLVETAECDPFLIKPPAAKRSYSHTSLVSSRRH
jgi:hypothetical protein